MEIICHLRDDTCDVMLNGKFTFADHPEFRAVLQYIADPNVRHVILRMARLEFVDSAALGMLLLANDEAKKHHKRLIISGANSQVKKMFNMARFNTLFTMTD